MFEKFGEFDSAEELNECAAGLKDEGDIDSLYLLAAENGLEKEDVEDYLEGYADSLCNPLMAALGKLKIEKENLKPKQIMEDWVRYIETQCTKNEGMAAAVRRKGRSLRGCTGAILKEAFEHQMTLDTDIVKAAGINAGKVTLGMPGMKRVNEIICRYYMEG